MKPGTDSLRSNVTVLCRLSLVYALLGYPDLVLKPSTYDTPDTVLCLGGV